MGEDMKKQSAEENESQVESPEQVARVREVFTEEFIAHVRGALPWLGRLSMLYNDEQSVWVAKFVRGGEDLFAEVGPDIPSSPSEFVAAIKRSIAATVDHTKMDALASEIEAWDETHA